MSGVGCACFRGVGWELIGCLEVNGWSGRMGGWEMSGLHCTYCSVEG